MDDYRKVGFKVLAVFMCLGVISILFSKKERKAPSESVSKVTQPQYFDHNEPSIDYDYNGYNQDDFNLVNYNNLLLVDSVISTIQTYYVDQGRVSNRKLFDSLIASLVKTENLEITKFSDSIKIKHHGKELRLKTPKVLSGEAFIEHFLKMEKFLKVQKESEEVEGTQNESSFYNDEIVLLLKNLIGSLDAHSSLLSKDDYLDLQQGTNGKFGGLGVLVGMRNEILTVIKPLPHSPAERLGISSKDKILSIDGQDTYGYSLGDLVEYMRGDPGTKVNIDLLRDGAFAVEEVELTREVIFVDSVERDVVTKDFGNILVLKINSFSARTVDEVKESISFFKRVYGEKSLKGFILDLRSNPGGLLDQAVKLSDVFLKNGTIVSTKGKHTEIEFAYDQGQEEVETPLIVLMNEESASASEIVAGALQDHQRGVVIGQPSFGKGSVQTIFELPEQRALKLTIARYYTPAGRSIQNIGIYPDIWLQPIYKIKDNNNLLGDYRYKNEKFLNFHLSNNDFIKSTSDTQKLNIKGYYTKNKADEFDQYPDQDVELEVASLLLEEINNVFKSSNNKLQSRSHHWIEIARKKIDSRLASMNVEVKKFLNEEFNVNWMPKIRDASHNVSINITSKSHSSILPGEKFNLKFNISNVGSESEHRISVYVRNENDFMDTYEKLIGEIEAKSVFSGNVLLSIPTYKKSGTVSYEVGVAVDGVPVASINELFKLNILERETPELSLSSHLVQEVGGLIVGELEADEKAKIAVKIKNESLVSAHNLEMSIINLSGMQIDLSKQKQMVKLIKPGQEAVVYFDIHGSDKLVTKEVDFGVLVNSVDLRLPMKEKFTVSSYPTERSP